ncbi:unnamed protein product [Triticum turgidum subsp. durum]|uniref:Uncharacterized protein n=1 Tax=Triticum turgidum subsp. durum TaxID=4567 RepID=A0A9R0R860_TRITD|nr:unnamed protein product [Triticum turgidum subsp. durum]
MTVIDFIDLSDHDIIDLSSSDDETVQEDHIATQHRAASLDRQTVHVIAGEGIQDVQAAFVATSEGRQDVQAVFAAASEGRQEAADCGHALEATTSSLVTEKEPLVAASEGSQDVQAVLVAAREGSQDVQAAFVAVSEGSQEAADSGNGLEATASSLVTEKAPLDMAESHNCTRSPTSAPFPSPTSTFLKAPTFEGGDAKMVRGKVKRPRKNYHTSTPRTSPRFEPKHEYHNGPVEELPAEALTSEVGYAELVRGKLKHPRKNYPADTPRTSPMFEPKRECHNGSVGELPAKVLTSEGGDAELVRGEVKHSRKNYHTGTPRTSPRFETKRECRNGSVEELPAEALTSDGADAELVRGKVKHARKDYHTGIPRTSPRFQLKHERRKGPVEEPAADHKRFRKLEELIASPDNAESAMTPSTDSLN